MFYNIYIPEDKAALWFLGQAGYYIKSRGISILIDPYLSNSVGKSNELFNRAYPVPVSPDQLKADLYIVTHDHLDHLDPETIKSYGIDKGTKFVAPRLASKKLGRLGIKDDDIITVDQGDKITVKGVNISGIFALATSADVLDTTGYLIEFANGKSVYHTSDTSWCNLLRQTAPYADVLLVCINGKFGNLNIAEAIELAKEVNPAFIIPNHYDVMEANSENPETFRYMCQGAKIDGECVIMDVLKAFIW